MTRWVVLRATARGSLFMGGVFVACFFALEMKDLVDGQRELRLYQATLRHASAGLSAAVDA